MVLVRREDIDLNQWYSVEDITVILGMTRAKARAVLAKHQATINKGILLPNLFKTRSKWTITGRGLVTLLDILNKGKQEETTMSKKTFAGSEAMQFISEQGETVEAGAGEVKQEQPFRAEGDIKQAKSIDFDYIQAKEERKTKRLQLVLKPSLHEKLKAVSAASGASVNDYVGQLLEAVLRDK